MAGDRFMPEFKAQPYWWDAAEPATRDTAVPDRTGVAIIGGGYAGLSAALTLRRLGHHVTVLDAERIGWGASSRNGGMVSGKVQLGADALNSLVGNEKAAEITATCSAALPFIEETIARERIDCDYARVGRFTGACTPRQFETQAANVAGMATMSGLPARMVPRAEQRDFIGSDFYHGGMLSDATGSLHPGKYARGLAAAAEQAGAVLADQARVTGVTRDGPGFRVATERFEIRADAVLTATNGYSLGPGNASAMPWLARRLVPVASYIIATEQMPRETILRLFPKLRMMGETRRVLNYFRPSPDGTRVIWGGRASFRSVSATQAAPALHAAMTQVFPELAATRITHAWNGNVAFTFDHLPHIGVQDGVHYAAGCQGSGVAMATWLGHNVALKMAGATNTAFPLDGLPFATRPFYNGDPWWVLPVIGTTYRLRDRIDRARISNTS
jgi:glycine/D-amino acid oxidase-like deaminating enzyme